MRTQQEQTNWLKILSDSEIEGIAKVCHEANKAYCSTIGDNSQPAWDEAPDWQRKSAIAGVKLHLRGDFGPQASHESWLAEKENDGWVYGKTKDPSKKEHPCMVPFEQLQVENKLKDFLFRAVVHAHKECYGQN